MPDDSSHPKAVWFGLGKQILAFSGGVILAAYVLGQRTGKVNDLVLWRDAIAPKIERMDSVGSLSFDHFHKQYEKDQHRIDERLRELEKDVKELQKKLDP